LEKFRQKWRHEPLVIDKLFAVEASRNQNGALANMRRLVSHESYKITNPNRVRATLGGLVGSNPQTFHQPSGSGYRFFTEQIMAIDKVNPQIAARLLGVFDIWRKLDLQRQTHIKNELARIRSANDISKNTLEIAGKMLG